MPTREISRAELKGGGYLALPEGSGPHPGVVVIHEVDGLDDQIQDVTRRSRSICSSTGSAPCMTRDVIGLLVGSVHRGRAPIRG